MMERHSTDDGYEERILDAATAAQEPSDVHPPPFERGAVKHTLTITIEKRDDGKLMVSTSGNVAGGDWERREVRFPHALELGLHSIRRATGSGDHEGPKIGGYE